MIESEFVKGLQNVIQTMRKLLGEDDRTNMDETCGTKRSYKTGKIRHGQYTEKDTEEHQQGGIEQ